MGYLIHLDANSRGGRHGFDYRWQDLPAVARDLDTSPLYAFYYLKKWQRQLKREVLPLVKARQYLDYVNVYLKGGEEMSHARNLTLLYRQFYRAGQGSSSAYNVLRPLTLAARVILEADERLFDDAEALTEAVLGELRGRLENSRDRGQFYFPKGSTRESRETAMREFATYFVKEVFYGAFHGDRSALRGKQLNLLKNACEAIYLDEAARDRAEREAVEAAS